MVKEIRFRRSVRKYSDKVIILSKNIIVITKTMNSSFFKHILLFYFIR